MPWTMADRVENKRKLRKARVARGVCIDCEAPAAPFQRCYRRRKVLNEGRGAG